MSEYTLTIFDCDGVLVDSEPAANRVMVEMLAGVGFEIGLEDCMARFVGKSMATVLAEVEAETGLTLPLDWPGEVRARTIEALQRERVGPIPGIHEVVAAHRAMGRPYCVASSGRVEKMHATLGSAGLLEAFSEVLFSATMVERGKPAPDLFLHAAQTMGHLPAACVVVEDSLPGVQAAVAAGMRVCAYAAAPYVDAAAYGELGAEVFTDMAALPWLLGLGGATG
jgi:HAD superfamily hydrolase (TIGR01509 family)